MSRQERLERRNPLYTPRIPAPRNPYTREEMKALSDAGELRLGHAMYGKDWEGVSPGERAMFEQPLRLLDVPLYDSSLLSVEPMPQIRERRFDLIERESEEDS